MKVSNLERDFKGVWIPKEVWLNEELGWTEKMLLVEIESLDKEQGCYAKNDHFAAFFGLSKDRISKLITSLNRKGYIEVKLIYKEGTKAIEKRIIRVVKNRFYGIGENAVTSSCNHLEGVGENTDTPIGENAVVNNTSINNTNNNTRDKESNVDDKSPTPAPLKTGKRIFEEHEHPLVLAKYLHELIKRNNPYAKEPNFQEWGNHIRLMHEVDGIEYSVIQNCISWCQNDSFWYKNILSTKKLREKFQTLYMQAQDKKGGNAHAANRNSFNTAPATANQEYADGLDF